MVSTINKKAQIIGREFPMTDRDFTRIRHIAYEATGITLSDHKKNMVYGRLTRRLRRLNIDRFCDYCDLIEHRDAQELSYFVNAITTNLTAFFRENHHFEYMKNVFIPELIRENAATRRIRIWSAGCSTGEEPYSIAMVLKSFPQLINWDVKVLATDLDSDVVAKAKSGDYPMMRIDSVPREYKRNLQFDNETEQARVKDAVKKFITFKQLNLLHPWKMKGPFDAIFCRNVVIYFDMNTRKLLFNRYADILSESGMLFVGHSESLQKVSDRFISLGKTIYRKKT